MATFSQDDVVEAIKARLAELDGIARAAATEAVHLTKALKALSPGATVASPARRRYRVKYTHAELIDGMRELAARVGHTPTVADLNAVDSGTATVGTYVKHFGSLSNAQREAGLTPNCWGKRDPSPLPPEFPERERFG